MNMARGTVVTLLGTVVALVLVSLVVSVSGLQVNGVEFWAFVALVACAGIWLWSRRRRRQKAT
jgi:hypothetical protein